MIRSVDKAIGILSLFSYAQPRWGITEMSQALDLPKGTAHNLVRTLTAAGFLQQDPETRRYSLGPKLFTLGSIMVGTLEINQKAAGPAQRLAARTGLICRVAIWDTDAVLITLNVSRLESEATAARIGPRVAAYCSALGRALLAYFEPPVIEDYLRSLRPVGYTARTLTAKAAIRSEIQQTRSRGYAVNDQELAPGRASLAVPIFQRGGSPAAALSLTGEPKELLGKKQAPMVAALQAATAEISRYMGFFEAVP
jgi:DNA-binding IclR family transcriptional regulator